MNSLQDLDFYRLYLFYETSLFNPFPDGSIISDTRLQKSFRFEFG